VPDKGRLFLIGFLLFMFFGGFWRVTGCLHYQLYPLFPKAEEKTVQTPTERPASTQPSKPTQRLEPLTPMQSGRPAQQPKPTESRGEPQRANRGPMVNIRTATIAELQTIPRVNRYRAQEIQGAVRVGLVRSVNDLLKIQGIDQATLTIMKTRAYWE
jgi:DNA uptake protein ComE-like DNA-binding protein